MHVVEPIFRLLRRDDAPSCIETDQSGAVHSVRLAWAAKDGAPAQSADIVMSGDLVSPIAFDVFTADGHRHVVMEDSFYAFRAALATFVSGVQSGKSASSPTFLRALVTVIEKGIPA